MEERSHILGRAAGVELPADYRKFLDKYAGGAKLTDGTMRFSLATAEVLAAPFPFDRPRMDRPLFEAHFIYLGRMRDAGVLVFEGAAPVSPDRYAKMVTIGFGERPDALEHGLPPTHVVVLDPADGSVRLVPIDPPAVVRRVADSFGKWFRKVKAKPAAKAAAKGGAKPAKGRKVAKAGAKAKVLKKPPAKKAPAKTTVLATLKKQQRLTLPAPYERFLKSRTAKHVVETADGRSWQLATPEELAETSYSLTETAAAKPVPFVRCTRSFADLLKAAEPALKGVPVVGEAKKKFTLARLRKGVCVGASDGDPVFLDPSTKYTVWTYSQDRRTVAKLAESFAAFIKPGRTRKPVKKVEALKRAA
jgi:hypothetical protein